MNRALLVAGLLLLPGPLRAWGSDPRVALLWVPDNTVEIRYLSALLASYNGLKLTVALTPGQLTPLVLDSLRLGLETGRLELAMRIPGDPILPGIHGHPKSPRPQDTLDRIATVRERFRVALSSPGYGFVPGAGTVSPGMMATFQAMGLAWVAVGAEPPEASSGSGAPPESAPDPVSWPGQSLPLVPFTSVRTLDRYPGIDDLGVSDAAAAAARLVVDEAGGDAPRGSTMSLLRALSQKRPDWRWETVSESLRADGPPAQADEPRTDWPGWSGNTWSGEPGQDSAWRAYGNTAAALKRYMNSGTADLKALESATESLYTAQSSRYYRLLGDPASAGKADRELRSHLMAVYRRIKQSVPGELYSSFLAAEEADASARPRTDDVSTDIQSASGPNWATFQNPAGSISRAPEPDAPSTGTAAPWKILGLRVHWDDKAVGFVFRMAAMDPSAALSGGDLGRLVLDVYMDINHVAGAGSAPLLEGRGAFAANRDCWEFALSAGRSGAVLLQSTPGEGPVLLGRMPVSVDAAKHEARVSVPRSLLRGNPGRWGYIVAAFAAKGGGTKGSSSRAAQAPSPSGEDDAPAPAVLQGGPLGALTPLEMQKAAITGGAGKRLNAVRLQQ